MKRTPDEIAEETKNLETLRGTLPKFDFFGGNNWEKIDAQIDIINGRKDYEDFEHHDDDDIEVDAYDAEQWLNGEIDSLTKDEL